MYLFVLVRGPLVERSDGYQIHTERKTTHLDGRRWWRHRKRLLRGTVVDGGWRQRSLPEGTPDASHSRYFAQVSRPTYLRMSTDFSRRRARVEHECVTEPRYRLRRRTPILCSKTEETYLSRPSPTAMIRLLSPSHSRSFLHQPRRSAIASCNPRITSHCAREYLVLSLQALVLTDRIPNAHWGNCGQTTSQRGFKGERTGSGHICGCAIVSGG